MLRRSIVAAALCALAGCQDYNFNPVGKCVIQPGSSRVTLSNVSSADILFVVDDSGSMAPEQARLAKNFRAFIDALAAAQAARINQDGLEPFEFHIAVTTSSVFEAWQTPNPTLPVTCGGTPSVCDVRQTHYGTPPAQVSCDTSGATCDELLRNYYFTTQTGLLNSCSSPGNAVTGTPFPAGDFVGAAGNSKVLHFTKDLDWAHWPAQPDPRISDLISQFQANINVGTCGSGLEQHLEAGYLAMKKALRQDGLSQVTGVAASDFPHAGAKLVVVWVGDEDDCSSANDPLKSLALTNARSAPGSDVCMDAERGGGTVTLADGRTVSQFPLSRYEDFFTSLGKTFSAAFVYSAVKNPDGSFSTGDINVDSNPNGVPNLLCQCACPPECASCADNAPDPICRTPATCGGNSRGNRINTFASHLRGKGVETFEASVCDANWATTLQSIANLVKPQRGLNLPSQPATSDVAILRIEAPDADPTKTRFCQGPGDGLDWNFVDCTTGTPAAAGVTTSCITIDHTPGRANTCCIPRTSTCSDAKPGETYIMQYLGLVPAPSALNVQGGCATAAECSSQLGGTSTDWQCFRSKPTDLRGTCVCQGT